VVELLDDNVRERLAAAVAKDLVNVPEEKLPAYFDIA
jgi:hypothetical protein